MIDVRPAVTRADLDAFIDLPYRLYRRRVHWVPPLRFQERRRFDRRTNPFLEHADAEFLIACDNGRTVGRIAAIDDARHNEVHGDNLASFGCVEAESSTVARVLLDRAEAWARARGRSAIRGPLSLSLNETAGLLVKGFDGPPYLLMPYNPPEYATWMDEAGYSKVKDLYAWSFDLSKPLDPGILDLADRARKRHQIRIASPTRQTMSSEIPALLEIYSRAWAGNWGFVPPTAAESRRFARDLRWIADPSLVLVAEAHGRRVGFAVAVPDLNQVLHGTSGRAGPKLLARLVTHRRHIDRARLLLLGVLPEYRGLGLFPILLAELSRRAAGSRFRTAEFSWVLEDNADINQTASRVGAMRSRTYRLYQKGLGA